MSDTSGFFKREGDSTTLLWAPNFVRAPTFTLFRDTHADQTYPQDGWTWYDDAADAYTAHGLPSQPDPSTDTDTDDLYVAVIAGL